MQCRPCLERCHTPPIGPCHAGVPEPHEVKARDNEDSAVLVATKASYNEIISHYPEHSDIIHTNMLMQFGLDRNGDDLRTTSTEHQSDDEGYAQLRGAIKAWTHSLYHANICIIPHGALTCPRVGIAGRVGHVKTVSLLLFTWHHLQIIVPVLALILKPVRWLCSQNQACFVGERRHFCEVDISTRK